MPAYAQSPMLSKLLYRQGCYRTCLARAESLTTTLQSRSVMIIQCLKPFDSVAKAQCEVEIFAGAYASRVRTEYESLDQDQDSHFCQKAAKLCAIAKPTWEEIFLLELLSIKLMSLQELEAKKTIIREKFSRTTRSESPDTIDPIDRLNSSLKRAKDLFGEDIAKFSTDLLKFSSVSDTHGEQNYTENLRAELMAKVSEMQWSFRKTIEREKAYSRLRITTTAVGSILVALFLLAYQLMGNNIAAWCAAFGALGALTSVLRRLYLGAIKENEGSYISTAMLSSGSSSVTFSLSFGPVFAFVLLLFFAGGFISGDMFPSIAKLNAKIDSSHGFGLDVESAKLTLWCFIAGFAEKFVPDVLDNIAGRKVVVGEAPSKPQKQS